MKIWPICFAICVMSFSCKRDEAPKANYGYNYLPLEIGRELVYHVDSTYFNDFTGTDSTYSFTIKDRVAETFTDAAGRTVFRIEQSRKKSDTAEFDIVGSYSIYKDKSLVEKTQDNLRVVPLVFPIRSGHQWDGNIFNTRVEDHFQYAYFDQSTEVNGITMDSSLRVLQLVDTQNFIVKRFDEEQYARGVGLIYKEHLYTVRKTNGDSGVHIIMQLDQRPLDSSSRCSKKAYSMAISLYASNRPDAPPCPYSIFVLSNSMFWSVFKSRNFATHFAGSQYCT